MKIDIPNNEIQIYTDTNSLNIVTKSQLSFWGFKQVDSYYRADLQQQLFLKLIKYFDDESIVYELSDKAELYSQELEIVNLSFENIKLQAQNFKNGIFDKIGFEDFRSFSAEFIQRTLKIHQLKAAYHLYILGNGANFSVPGSGKTSVVLTVYEKLRQEGKVNMIFVVGPPSSFGPWRNEFKETLGREANYTVMAGGNKLQRKNSYYGASESPFELYLTTYQTLLSDKSHVKKFLAQKHINAFFIVDEAHYIKQLNGNWAQAILSQAEGAKYRCVLTGTPMPKSYTDVFNLFDFLWPNQNPISSDKKTTIKVEEERGNAHSVKNILNDAIGPLFYRVRKTDLNLKPQNFITPYAVKMEYYERTIYDAIHKRIRDYSKKEYFQNIEFINKIGRGRIMRLRQSISYAKLLNSAIEDYDESLLNDSSELRSVIKKYDSLEVPGKIKCLLTIVRKLRSNGSKVVIWSNFIETLKLIERHLTNEGYYCKKIYGGTPIEGSLSKDEETREKIRDEFVDRDSNLDILIANPAACAESISLHKTCHEAIYYDLSYNCAQYLQSLDRIHRVGGSELIEANYHFLQYKDTIDIDIKENIDKKTKKMFEIIEEDYSIYSMNMFEQEGDAEAYERIFIKKK